MSELTYLILKFGFLALMWVFVFVVVYALRSDLFGQSVRRLVAPAKVDSAASDANSANPPTRLPIATAGTRAPGVQMPSAANDSAIARAVHASFRSTG